MNLKKWTVSVLAAVSSSWAVADIVQFSIGRKTPVLDGRVAEGEYGAYVPYMYEDDIAAYGDEDRFPLAVRSPRSYFAWDDEYIYMAMVSEGARLKTRETLRDGKLYYDDSVDFCVSHNDPKKPVYHFIFNSAGVMYDARSGDAKWNSEGVKVASKVDGGLWTLEAAVPWKTLGFTPAEAVFAPHLNLMRTYLGGGGAAVKWIDADERSSVVLAHGRFMSRKLHALVFLREETEIPDFPELVPPGAGENPVRRTVSFRNKAGKTVFWGSYPLVSKEPLVFRSVTSDIEKKRLLFRTENNFPASDDYRIELDFRRMDGGASVLKLSAPAAKRKGQVMQSFDVSALPVGAYRLYYRFLRPDSTVLSENYTYYARGEEHPPWENCTAGAEDEVPPPWTKPVFRRQSFDCWGRTVEFGGGGLVSSSVSAGREQLASPVSLVLDGKRVAFSVESFTPHVSYADWVFVADDATVPVRVKCRAEFDGYMWFEVERGAGKVRSLKVEVPLRRDGVTGFDDGHSVIEKLSLAPGVKGSWKVNPADNPFLWLGDGKVGMMIGSEDLRGWNLSDRRNGYRLDVDDRTAKLTITFVDTETASDRPVGAGFYLNPTPVRPKNLELQDFDPSKMCRWTGNVSSFMGMNVPGMMLDDKIGRYRKRQAAGERVFWYGGSALASPYSPIWAWWGGKWNYTGDPSTVYLEMDPRDRVKRDRGGWIWGCLREKGFFDFKTWSTSWFLNEERHAVSNLYFDISFPKACNNAAHGCKGDYFFRGMREFHKRTYRQLKRRNPLGAMLGHVRFVRTPSDNFFCGSWCGEAYETQVARQHNYYGLLNPEAMQIHYASRAVDMVMGISVQIYRTYQVYHPKLLAGYDPYEREADRAIRHAAAYFKIHNLLITVRPEETYVGRQWWQAESAPLPLGPDRRYSAYYLPDCPVTVDKPDRLFLYALYTGRGKGLLILLNDTDDTVVKTVRADAGKLGLGCADGVDMFGRGRYSLGSGEFTVTLPPRESRFIKFGY